MSHARVLVEVDITKDFVKDIKVRDTTGREFTQRAVPEWQPLFCHKCNKVGHKCKETKDPPNKPNQREVDEKEEKKTKGEKKIWHLSAIAKLMTDVTNVEELLTKLTAGEAVEEEKNEDEVGLSRNPTSQLDTHANYQEETEEEGWTQGVLAKVACRQ